MLLGALRPLALLPWLVPFPGAQVRTPALPLPSRRGSKRVQRSLGGASWGGQNEVPQLWLKTAGIYGRSGSRKSNSTCGRAGRSRGGSFCPSGSLVSLARDRHMAAPASVFSWPPRAPCRRLPSACVGLAGAPQDVRRVGSCIRGSCRPGGSCLRTPAPALRLGALRAGPGAGLGR